MSEQNNTHNTCTVPTSKQIHVNGLKECITICKYTSTQIMLVISQKSQLICYILETACEISKESHSDSIWATHCLYMNYIKTLKSYT